MRALVWRGGALGDFLLTLPVHDLLDALPVSVDRAVLERTDFHELALRGAGAREARDPAFGGFHALFADDVPMPRDLGDWLASFDVLLAWLPGDTELLRSRLESTGIARVRIWPPYPAEPSNHHQAEWHLSQVSELFGTSSSAVPVLFAKEPREAIQERLCIHVGAGSERKRWPAERLAEVARQLGRDASLEICLISGPADDAAREAMIEALGPAPFRDWRSLPLAELARKLRRSRLYLGHDTGPSHLAAACGCASIALYGPTDPNRWGIRGPGPVRHLRAPSEHLEDLSVDVVLGACYERLSATADRTLPTRND
ncbi:MAG: glycosyltransferase family 9 protein [Planctomycetota bacterium]